MPVPSTGWPITARRRITWPHLAVAAAVTLLGACDGPTVTQPDRDDAVTASSNSQIALFTAPAVRGYGSLSGTVRVSLGADDEGLAGARSLVSVGASRAGESPRFVWGTFSSDSDETASFSFDSLPPGTWTLNINERHPPFIVFPAMQLSFDSIVTVKIRGNRSVVLPEVALRPVAPFLVVATELCPWPIAGPPTLEDWGKCDSGYWGGLDVEVVVKGVAGTATAGVSMTFVIKQEEWFAVQRSLPPGDYDVTGVAKERSSSPWSHCATGWRLVPWRPATKRMRLDGGLSYTEFEFWCQR